jgi:hypothetical protein
MSKPKNKGSVNVDAVRREVKKMVQDHDSKHDSKPQNPKARSSIHRESPLEQEMGTTKYKQMIHDHNEKNAHILDRLPFTFPAKKKIRSHLSVLLECPECGDEKWGSEHTVGFVCSKCNKYVSAKNPEAESRGYDPDLKVGIRGTASDKLRLLEERDKKKGQ